jgi:hypothetical protein
MVAGYSRLAASDEERTLARLRALWSDRLVRRRRSHLHREEHSSGSARRDATGVAVQELTEACGPGEETRRG